MKAEEKGKQGAGAPEDEQHPWSCGKVKWELPKEDRRFRNVGKLKVPVLLTKETQKEAKQVGKLKWGGFSEDEPKKEAPKEKPVVRKLKVGADGVLPPPAEDERAQRRKKQQEG